MQFIGVYRHELLKHPGSEHITKNRCRSGNTLAIVLEDQNAASLRRLHAQEFFHCKGVCIVLKKLIFDFDYCFPHWPVENSQRQRTFRVGYNLYAFPGRSAEPETNVVRC